MIMSRLYKTAVALSIISLIFTLIEVYIAFFLGMYNQILNILGISILVLSLIVIYPRGVHKLSSYVPLFIMLIVLLLQCTDIGFHLNYYKNKNYLTYLDYRSKGKIRYLNEIPNLDNYLKIKHLNNGCKTESELETDKEVYIAVGLYTQCIQWDTFIHFHKVMKKLNVKRFINENGITIVELFRNYDGKYGSSGYLKSSKPIKAGDNLRAASAYYIEKLVYVGNDWYYYYAISAK